MRNVWHTWPYRLHMCGAVCRWAVWVEHHRAHGLQLRWCLQSRTLLSRWLVLSNAEFVPARDVWRNDGSVLSCLHRVV